VRRWGKRLARLVVALADQAPTSARNKPKTPPDSKTNYVAAFFDSIDPNAKSGANARRPLLVQPHKCAVRSRTRQLNNSKPLMISITAAVLPWMPKAAALLPPWCKTIAASPTGMRVATSINQPSGCVDP
jgi:hypothetical protein